MKYYYKSNIFHIKAIYFNYSKTNDKKEKNLTDRNRTSDQQIAVESIIYSLSLYQLSYSENRACAPERTM